MGTRVQGWCGEMAFEISLERRWRRGRSHCCRWGHARDLVGVGVMGGVPPWGCRIWHMDRASPSWTSLLGHMLVKPPVLGCCVPPSLTGVLGKNDMSSALWGLQSLPVGPAWGPSHSLSIHAIPPQALLRHGPQTLSRLPVRKSNTPQRPL